MQKKTARIVLLSALFLSLAGVVVFAYNNRSTKEIDEDLASRDEIENGEFTDGVYEEDEEFIRKPGAIQSFADKLSSKFSEAQRRNAHALPRTSFRYSDDEFGTFL